MASNNASFTEVNSPYIVLKPDVYAASAHTGVWLSPVGFQRTAFLIALQANANPVVVKLQEATDNAGTGAQDITGKTYSFATSVTDQIGVIEVGNVELSEGYDYITAVATPATTSAEFSVSAIFVTPNTTPANDHLAVNIKG